MNSDHVASPPKARVAAQIQVVLLAGFAMSQHHLEKYRGLYGQFGVAGSEGVVPGLACMTVPRLCDRYAKRLAERLDRGQGPLVLHVFSGAVWIYFALNQFASAGLRRLIVGIVFESTPLDVQAEQFGRFAAWFAGRRYRPAWSRPFVPYRRVVGISARWEARNRAWMRAIPVWVQVLAIHSRQDPVADANYIQRYLDTLASLGCGVSALTLDSARHCLAIRDEPASYRAALGGWLARLYPAPSRPDIAEASTPAKRLGRSLPAPADAVSTEPS